MIKMTFNGRRITSSSQLKRELERSFDKAIERHVRSAAPPSVRLRKTPEGFIAEGSEDEISRMVRRLT
ncbi:MAG: hypothetical protein ACK4RV_06125 [Caulobacter sp.]